MTEDHLKEEAGKTPGKRPPVVIVLAMLLFLLSTGGFYGGIMLLMDISGGKLGTPLSMLDHLPIDTFLLPGLTLLIFMGIIPLIATLGVLRRELFPFFNRFRLLKSFTWAYCASVFTGIFLVGWTAGEIILWGVNSLSVIYLLWGVFLLLICLIPKIRDYYTL